MTSLHTALALARRGQPPGPDIPAGHQVTPWPGEPHPVPPRLDRLLRLSLGGGRLRPAASAGALHPVNTHLLLGPDNTVPPGRYAYDPVRHRLLARGTVTAGTPPGAVAVLTVTARRTVSHYGHRAWPLLLLDTGHATAALALAGASHWCPDADVTLLAAAAGLPPDWHGAEPEHPLAAVRLTPGPADALDHWAAHAPGAPPLPTSHTPPPVLREAWRLLGSLPGTTTWRPTAAPELPDATLTSRRSAQPPFPGVPARTLLEQVLATARRTAPVPWRLLTARPRGTAAAPAGEAAPADLAARAAGQSLLGQVGALLVAHGCPDDAPPARVRRDHVLAGHGAGLAQAVATHLGLASRPIGSWQHGPCGPPHIVHALALGVRTQPPEGTDRP
ncbi:hypothetical protein [Streptomyces sp. NRRL F-5065]|uniref:hypothetical protein n=1 Tax=Streptomyces sp. NRRL F-5065 TaxID=1463855 RepID=UPI0004BFAEDF|nr:hypothetical protein [Streptomyces sp. NRRL F-5065]